MVYSKPTLEVFIQASMKWLKRKRITQDQHKDNTSPWIEKRKQNNQEKTTKYAPLRWELKQQHKGYTIKQYNIIIDVLGGYSSETRENVILLLGKTKADKTLFNMQKAVISSTLNITRSFKVLS